MSAALFISYRRSDTAGHAGRLNDRLQDWVRADELFYDQRSIDIAESFHDEIATNVATCKLMLVLMGPDWLSVKDAQGQRRLLKADDVVRGEVALALKLGKTVIGVRFDGAPLPTAADLPEDLQPFALRTMVSMEGRDEQYASNVQMLLRHVADAGVPLRRALVVERGDHNAALVPPERLPLLCDRAPQCEQVHDALALRLQSSASGGAGGGQPVVCVLHGAVQERHDFFIERLHSRELPLQLARTAWAKGLRCVDIADKLPLDDDAAFARRLRLQLAQELEIDAADDAALLAGLQHRKVQLLTLSLGWQASETAGKAAAALQRVRNYWAAFPPLPAGLSVLCLLVLKYDSAPRKTGFFGRLFGGGEDAAAQALREEVSRLAASPPAQWCITTELPSIEAADLTRWLDAARKALGRSLPIRTADLQAIVAEGPQPMERVHDELQRLMRQALSAQPHA